MKNPGSSFEMQSFFTRDFRDRALRRKIAVEDCEVAIRFDRSVEISDDILAHRIVRDISEIFSQSPAGDGHTVAVQHASVQHALH